MDRPDNNNFDAQTAQSHHKIVDVFRQLCFELGFVGWNAGGGRCRPPDRANEHIGNVDEVQNEGRSELFARPNVFRQLGMCTYLFMYINPHEHELD